MQMKVFRQVSCFAMILLLALVFTVHTYADTFPGQRASTVFNSTSVALNKSKEGAFGATTYNYYDIKVSSVTLQKQNGTKWEDVKSLTAPSKVAKDTTLYTSTESYSASISGTGTFRLKAVFSAGGATTTSYSGSMSL